MRVTHSSCDSEDDDDEPCFLESVHTINIAAFRCSHLTDSAAVEASYMPAPEVAGFGDDDEIMV